MDGTLSVVCRTAICSLGLLAEHVAIVLYSKTCRRGGATIAVQDLRYMSTRYSLAPDPDAPVHPLTPAAMSFSAFFRLWLRDFPVSELSEADMSTFILFSAASCRPAGPNSADRHMLDAV